MNDTLLLGFGNPDRQDDGIAWHILQALSTKLGLPSPDSYEDEFPENERLDLLFTLQLTPEMAEDISRYRRVVFVDAHTGEIPDPIRMDEVQSEFQRSPFTHHLTPQSLLAMCETLYKHRPLCTLLSARGYRFGFARELSAESDALVPIAVRLVQDWLATTA
jgi:hydrogenase maturation protease